MLNQTGTPLTNILLIDDHPIVRLGFAALLRQADPSLVFYETDDPVQAVQIARQHMPSIALVDLSLAGTLSLELIKQLSVVAPATALLVVSMHDERLYAERVLKSGARGYIMKQVAAHSIAEAVRVIRRGGIWLSEAMRQETMGSMMSANAVGAIPLKLLSDRELAVFRLIGQGKKKSEIARVLNLSPNTIETYRSHIKHKLGMANGTELYKFAFLHMQESTS